MANKKRPMAITIGDSVFDKIQAFYINPEKYPLSETHEAIRKRWITVMNLQLKGFAKFKIANMLERDFGLSQSQAYIDIRNAENIFGNINKTDSEAFNQMWIEWTKDLLLESRKKGDRKTAAKCLDLLAKYGGLSEDKLEFNPEKLENKEIKVVLEKKQLDMLQQMLKKGVVDFNDLNVTDIDFEDVK